MAAAVASNLVGGIGTGGFSSQDMELASLRRSIDQKDRLISELRVTLRRLQNTADDQSRVRLSLERQVSELNAEKSALVAQLQALEAQRLQERETGELQLASASSAWSSTMSDMVKEKDGLVGFLSADVSRLQEENRELRGWMTRLQEGMTRLAERNEKLEAGNEKLQEENRELRSWMTRLAERNEKLEARNEKLEARNEKLEGEVEALKVMVNRVKDEAQKDVMNVIREALLARECEEVMKQDALAARREADEYRQRCVRLEDMNAFYEAQLEEGGVQREEAGDQWDEVGRKRSRV